MRSLTWSLRKYSKVVGKKTEDTDKQTICVRQNPIRETGWKHDRLKVPELGEAKIYMHRPLQGDPKEVTLVKKASGWYAHITCELPDTPKVEPTSMKRETRTKHETKACRTQHNSRCLTRQQAQVFRLG
ncbi:MAG: hypothetical protein OXL96_13650 [Candidatus Poribacteria bacterium]|nr:hypothetical protein [Candidatus Poribacteria bacterium]